MKNYIEFMSNIARQAGGIQMERLNDAHKIEYKGAINPVTEVDKACESLIVSEIHKRYPKDDILAEEGSGNRSESGDRWIVDPLDGTVNYAHKFPFFGVSIALERNGDVIAGVVYDSARDELFSAAKDGGAFLNGEKISVSNIPILNKSLLATGFAYNVQEEEMLDNLDNFSKFIKIAQAVRRPGSAAIDLAWVACGRIEGFWELFLKPWDTAAGELLIRESGGRVTTFNGKEYKPYDIEILASNGKIHSEMMSILLS